MTRIIINPFGRYFPIQKRVWTFFKNQFVSKMIYRRFMKQKACEKVLFYKVLIPSTFKSVTLERLWENQFVCESFTFQKEKWFQSKTCIKTLLFELIYENDMFYQTKVFQKTLVSKTCLKGPTSSWDIIWCSPCYSLLLRGVRSLWVWDLKWRSSRRIKDHSLG